MKGCGYENAYFGGPRSSCSLRPILIGSDLIQDLRLQINKKEKSCILPNCIFLIYRLVSSITTTIALIVPRYAGLNRRKTKVLIGQVDSFKGDRVK